MLTSAAITEPEAMQMIAALDRVRSYIRTDHPFGVDATIDELDIVRNPLASKEEGGT